MKKILIAGPGNSGSGAILDFLKSRNDISIPFKNEEFRFVNDPSGIQNLEENFYSNFSINNISNSYANFGLFCKGLSSFKNQQGKNVYPKEFEILYKKYMNEITYLSYNGMPRFQRFNLNLFEKIKFYFLKTILKKEMKNINMFKMILPIEKEKFIEISKKFIDDILMYFDITLQNKIALIDQGVNIFKLNENIKYFSNSKCILTIRDPRGTFHTIMQLKRKNEALGYQGIDLENFTKWYKFIYEKIKRIEIDQKNTLLIKFDDFVLNHEKISDKIINFLGLEKQHTSFDIKKSIPNVIEVEKDLDEKTSKFIKSELKDYLLF